ncbi:MAG: MG2 domain-containing protein [Arcicella sp.]|nr:MG2 domain-containing protein [Arcicella sp.]
MNLLKTTSLITTLFFFSFINNDDLLKKIVSQLEKYHQTYPQEKAYLHADKPYYVAGETLWFKAYLVEALTNRPDTVSVPLYVDLIDNAAGKIINQRIIKLTAGFGHGDFTLPDSLQTGVYRLRAYTNWMRNMDESLFYTKDFQVYSINQQEVTDKLNAEIIDFNFFAEGGKLIAGFDSRLAFKATDVTGKGLDVSGEIISSTGDTVQGFKSIHQGMGLVNFKPENGKSYRAEVRYQNIYSKTFDLPEIKPQGISMIVDNTSSKNNIRIILNSNIPDSEMLIIGQSKGTAFYAGRIPTDKKNAFLNIPKDKFPPGVAQFTVFDEKLRPHCERVVFIQPTQELVFNLKTDKTAYKTREKTNLDIEVKDNAGNPVEGNFSLSISDENQIKRMDEAENIMTNMLLSSDLKGNIENPAYYFDKTKLNAAYHLDILMMTQGWRRFKWQDILQENFKPTTFTLERGLTISGQATQLNGKPFDKKVNLTTIIGKDSTRQFLMSELEKNGSFHLYELDFKDSTKVTIQVMIEQENAKSNISFTPWAFPKISVVNKTVGVVEVDYQNLSDYLKYTKEGLELQKKLSLDKNTMLSEVAVKAKKIVKPPLTDRRVLYARAEATVKGDASPSALNVFELLKGRVAGVTVGGDRNNPTLAMRGATSFNLDGNPIYLIDGVPATKSTVLSIDINLVDRVEIVRSLAGGVMYGDQARNGIVSVFTKIGTFDDKPSNNEEVYGIATTKFMGYYATKEFYTPKYDQNLPQNIRPDYRSTVYWSPMISTNKEGKASVSYFNTDAQTDMKIHIEGITNNGLMGSGNGGYLVKK